MYRPLAITLLLIIGVSSGVGCSGGSDSPDDITGPTEPVDPQIQGLLDNLQQGSPQERIQAAQQAAQLGERARPAAERLCAGAIDTDEAVRNASLVALEKVHPALFPHARTLATVKDAYTRSAAIEAIHNMGREARAALPLLLFELKKDTNISNCLKAVGAIAPESRAARETLTAYLNDPPISADEQYARNGAMDAAAAGLGEMAFAEPKQRALVVDVLIPQLAGSHKAAALAALARCGPEAGKASEQVNKLRFDGDSEVQQAADKAATAIAGYTQAAGRLSSAGAPSSLAGLVQCAADAQDSYLRQLAGEHLRAIHPQLERFAAVLFRPRSPYSGPTLEQDLATMEPAPVEAGPAAVALAQEYAKRPDAANLTVYQALAKFSPQSPAVVQALIDACNLHVERRRQPVSREQLPNLPHYWVGNELVAIAADKPEVQQALRDNVSDLNGLWSFQHLEYSADVTRMLEEALASLTQLAAKCPEARAKIAATVTQVMHDRASTSKVNMGVRHDILEAALVACGPDAFDALKAENPAEYWADWKPKLLKIMREIQPADANTAQSMEFKVGDQLWQENGGWTLNVKVVEVLGNRYRVHNPNVDGPAEGQWVSPDQLRKPTWPVPRDGYQYGDLVEFEIDGRWVPATIAGGNYGIHYVTTEKSSKPVMASAHRIRPRAAKGDSTASGSEFKQGDKVQVEWRGTWYKAVVLKVEPDGWYRVHYDGYDSSEDETVGRDRLRKPAAEASKPSR